MTQCPSCGATFPRGELACVYCGSDHRPPVGEVAAAMARAERLYRSKAYEEAAPLLVAVIEEAPGTFRAYFFLADCLAMLGRPDAALAAMEKAAGVRPESSVVAFNSAVLAEKLGRTAEARRYLERALVLVSGDDSLDNRRQFKRQIRRKLRAVKRRLR